MNNVSNQILSYQSSILYFYSCACVVTAYYIGCFQNSFLSVVLLLLVLCLVWISKLKRHKNSLINMSDEMYHMKSAYIRGERCEWLNLIINQLFDRTEDKTFLLNLVDSLQPRVRTRLPASFVDYRLCDIKLKKENGIRFDYIRPLKSKETSTQEAMDDFGIEGMILIQIKEISMQLLAKNKRLPLYFYLKDLQIRGPFEAVFGSAPHASKISSFNFRFIEEPKLNFSISVLKNQHSLEYIPIVHNWLENLIQSSVLDGIVSPNSFVYKFCRSSPCIPNLTSKESKRRAIGVLIIKASQTSVKCSTEKIPLEASLCSSSTSSVTKSCCELSLGETGEQMKTFDNLAHNDWTLTCPMLLHSLQDRLNLRLFDSYLLGRCEIASYSIQLADYLIAQDGQKNDSTTSHTKGSFSNSINGVFVNAQFSYEPISKTEGDASKSNLSSTVAEPDVSPHGILLVKIHNAINLNHWEYNERQPNAFCVVQLGQETIGSTGVVRDSASPKWDEEFEVVAYNARKGSLNVTVYDWRGGLEACSEDLIGRTRLDLSQDQQFHTCQLDNRRFSEPIQSLGVAEFSSVAKRVNMRDLKAGSLVVTAVFKPCPVMCDLKPPGTRTDGASQSMEQVLSQSIAGERRTSSTKFCENSSGKVCKNLQLNIVAARNLICTDSQGASDPFCLIKLNKTVIGRTKVIKNCGDPIWNENFRMAMPSLNDMLKICVYDKDLVGKERLGKLLMTAEDLWGLINKSTDSSQIFGDGIWYPLIDVLSGEICISCRRIWTDTPVNPFSNLFPIKTSSPAIKNYSMSKQPQNSLIMAVHDDCMETQQEASLEALESKPIWPLVHSSLSHSASCNHLTSADNFKGVWQPEQTRMDAFDGENNAGDSGQALLRELFLHPDPPFIKVEILGLSGSLVTKLHGTKICCVVKFIHQPKRFAENLICKRGMPSWMLMNQLEKLDKKNSASSTDPSEKCSSITLATTDQMYVQKKAKNDRTRNDMITFNERCSFHLPYSDQFQEEFMLAKEEKRLRKHTRSRSTASSTSSRNTDPSVSSMRTFLLFTIRQYAVSAEDSSVELSRNVAACLCRLEDFYWLEINLATDKKQQKSIIMSNDKKRNFLKLNLQMDLITDGIVDTEH